jgi:hypothetical protein
MKPYFATLGIKGTYCYAECHYAECRYAECRGAQKLAYFVAELIKFVKCLIKQGLMTILHVFCNL